MTLTLLAAAAALFTAQPAPTDMKLIRQPAVHGDTVVFTYGQDLWTCTLSGGAATRLTTHPGQESNPRISPDGNWVAFVGTYDGNPDLYVMPIEGGEPKRLTYSPDAEIPTDWTKDGKIGFATADQTPFTQSLWLIDPKGGMPESTDLKEFSTGTFNADGTVIAYNRMNSYTYNWRRYRGGTQGFISFFNLQTGEYSEMPHKREQSYHPMWVGENVFFVSDRVAGTHNLYSYNVKSKATKQLTNFTDADMRYPNTDGKTIVFERDGVLYSYTIASGAVKAIQPKVVSDGVGVRPTLRKLNISDFTLSPSGKRIVVEARGEIFSLPAKNGETRNMTNSQGPREQAPAWSPDGKTILYTSDLSGEVQLYSMPQMGGKSEQLTSGAPLGIQSFRYSPDGKKVSISTYQKELIILDLTTKKQVKVFTAPEGSSAAYDWSPDSTYIAYIKMQANLQGAAFLYRVRDGKTTQITEGHYSDGNITFDLNGKYLYLTSVRTFIPSAGQFEFSLNFAPGERVYAIPLTKDTPNPLIPTGDEEGQKGGPAAGPTMSGGDEEEEEPSVRVNFATGASEAAVQEQTKADAKQEEPKKDEPKKEEPKKEEPKDLKIDFDGIANRLIALPWGPSSYPFILGANNGVFTISEGKLVQFDFASKTSVDILAGMQNLAFNANRTKLAYQAGPVLGIVDVRPGIQPGQGRVNTDAVEAVVDPRKEWTQIFNEAWRYQRDRFYDPNMTGVDWNAVKAQYAKYLPYVTTRQDLNYVLGMMIGELGTGHAYVGGGDNGPGMRPPVPIGVLGADYSTDGGKVRFKKIYTGEGYGPGDRGPLAEPGVDVKEGDYLLEIDGQSVGGSVYPYQLLQNKVGRTVVLTVNSKPSVDGARKVTVRPVGSDEGMRYADWVESNRKMVDRLSNGRIGYCHVPNTSEEGMIGFIRGYYSNSDKEAFLIDERFNGGGMIPTYFYEKILRKYVSFFAQRSGVDVGFPVQTMDGPYAMLINNYAGSGGDMFPWLFRQHKAGALIGTRTWGGLVGITGSAPLIDGGFLSSPEFGIYDHTTGEWIAENKGVDPDVPVDGRVDQFMKGEDPQIKAAVEHLLAELKKSPRKPIKKPAFPDIRKTSR